jgi:glycosyltransferase involved in cell wall biosynthesis
MRISIITACFNSHAVLATALRSVSTQTHPDVEHILVDGGSTDGTVKCIQAWAADAGGDRTKWISEPDHGLYDALNKGIRLATGEIIGVLHADDFYSAPEVLSKIAQLFVQTGADAVYADVKFVDAADTTRTVRYISGRKFRPWMMRYGFMPPHPSIFCRRALFEKLGYYRTDYRIAADHELMVRFLWKAGIRTAYLPEAIVTMRTGGMSTRSAGARWTACRENVRACRENGIYANLPMQLAKYAVKVFELRA